MPLLSLPEAKAHLNLTTDEQDDELNLWLDALVPVVEAEVGPVLVRQERRTVRHDNTGPVAFGVGNIRSVDEVTVNGTSVDTFGWTGMSGVISDATGRAPRGLLSIACTVGMNPIPGNVKAGALEVLAIAWQSQRGTRGEPPAFLIPYRAAAWFKPHQQVGGFA